MTCSQSFCFSTRDILLLFCTSARLKCSKKLNNISEKQKKNYQTTNGPLVLRKESGMKTLVKLSFGLTLLSVHQIIGACGAMSKLGTQHGLEKVILTPIKNGAVSGDKFEALELWKSSPALLFVTRRPG